MDLKESVAKLWQNNFRVTANSPNAIMLIYIILHFPNTFFMQNLFNQKKFEITAALLNISPSTVNRK